MNTIQNEILNYKATVRLAKPANGFWDGGAKDKFTFEPSIERSPGKPAIRWGSWEADLWFVVNVNKSVKFHFAQLRRKLNGSLERTITIEKIS